MLQLLLLVVLAIAIFGFIASVYTQLMSKRQMTAENWSVIETRLARRAEAADALAETLAPHLGANGPAMRAYQKARNDTVQAARGALPARIRAERQMFKVTDRLVAAAETHGNLRADPGFISARNALHAAEAHVRETCHCYNDSVQSWNEALTYFPLNLLASRFHLDPARYVDVDTAADRHGDHSVVTG